MRCAFILRWKFALLVSVFPGLIGGGNDVALLDFHGVPRDRVWQLIEVADMSIGKAFVGRWCLSRQAGVKRCQRVSKGIKRYQNRRLSRRYATENLTELEFKSTIRNGSYFESLLILPFMQRLLDVLENSRKVVSAANA